MKNAIKIISLLAMIQFSCGDNKSNDTITKSITVNTASSNEAIQSDGILGEWKLIIVTGDRNGNDQIDEAERKNGITHLEDYMKLNSDGSAVFLSIKARGRYEIKTNKSGKKQLYLYAPDNFEYSKGIILSVTKDELILRKAGDYSIWKRI